MKTMKTTFLAMALTILSSAVFATGNLKANLSLAGADKAVIEATNLKVGSFEIEVKDEYGKTIFSKQTEAGANYQRTYDFSALDDGVYHLHIKHGNEYYKKRLQLETGEVTVLEETKLAEPFFLQKDDRVEMTYLNFPGDEVNMYVYDKTDLLHKQELGNKFTVQKFIDMSELKPGSYTIVLTAGYELFEHRVTLQ